MDLILLPIFQLLCMPLWSCHLFVLALYHWYYLSLDTIELNWNAPMCIAILMIQKCCFASCALKKCICGMKSLFLWCTSLCFVQFYTYHWNVVFSARHRVSLSFSLFEPHESCQNETSFTYKYTKQILWNLEIREKTCCRQIFRNKSETNNNDNTSMLIYLLIWAAEMMIFSFFLLLFRFPVQISIRVLNYT